MYGIKTAEDAYDSDDDSLDGWEDDLGAQSLAQHDPASLALAFLENQVKGLFDLRLDPLECFVAKQFDPLQCILIGVRPSPHPRG